MIITDSSMLTHADFDSGVLTVTFKNNNSYRYFDVPQVVWDDFQNASSKGSYFSHHIKGNYKSEKV